MKDMYLDYNRHNRHENRTGRTIAIIVVVVLAVGIGIGGYFLSKYYLGMMEEQTKSSEEPEAAMSAAGIMQEQGGENAETGIYGLWTASSESDPADTEVSAYDNIDDDLWMADFDDTRTRVDAKGIYLSAQSYSKKIDDAIALIDETELNAVVIDIKSDYGYISWNMDCPLAAEVKALTYTITDINALMTKLKEHNIYSIARIVSMRDPVLAKARPDLAMCYSDGTVYKDNSGYSWLNPYKEEVWDYIIGIAKQCAAAGFDEVNFDYIRFTTDRGYKDIDFGEVAETVTKTEAITNGVRRACEELKPLGVFVSCDLFGAIISSSVDAKLVGQSYFQLGQYLDYVCPMVYPSHYGNGYYNLDYPDCHPYELVYHALQDSQKVLYMIDTAGNKADVRPWLQDFTATWVSHHLTYGKEEVRAQINAVYDAGYSGWLLWNAAVSYSKSALYGPEE